MIILITKGEGSRIEQKLIREAFHLKNVPKRGKSPQLAWPPPSPRKFWTFLNLGKM